MKRVEDLETPAVTIMLDRLEDNIARAQKEMTRHGIANRPHIKTHKIPAIARMQIEAGAIGITCQKLGEAEVFIDAGVTDDMLITYNILGEAKTEPADGTPARVRGSQSSPTTRWCCAAFPKPAAVMVALCRSAHRMRWGFGRNGVQTPEAALDLARVAVNLPRNSIRGADGVSEHRAAHQRVLTRAIELFKRRGHPVAGAVRRRHAGAAQARGLSR